MRKSRRKIHHPSLAQRMRRRLSIRKKVVGDKERPRVCINKSNRHLSAVVVDDSLGKILFSVQTFGKKGVGGSSNRAGAKLVGDRLVEKLKEGGIEKIVFDRAGYRYGGVISALADTVRDKGIRF